MPSPRIRKGRPGTAASALLVVGMLLAIPAAGSTDGNTLRVLKPMPFDLRAPYDLNESVNTGLRLLIDRSVHRGFLLIREQGGRDRIVVYDLQRLKRTADLPWPLEAFDTNVSSAVDEKRHRLVMAMVIGGGQSLDWFDCDQGTALVVLDTRRLTTTSHRLPCVGSVPFAVEGMSFHAASDKLYVVGQSTVERFATQDSGMHPPKQRTFFLQLDGSSFDVDWTIEATQACDWHTTAGNGIVTRVGDSIFSYCYQGGDAYNFGGTRGAAMVVSFDDIQDGRGPSFRVSPTYTDAAVPSVDPVTGRLLVRSEVPPYGPAVWGYDPLQERFFGVAPAGEPYRDTDDRFQGFDPVNGRLYIVHPKGTVVVDARGQVISGGVTYAVLAGMKAGADSGGAYVHDIAVDGSLRRLFIPYPKRNGFIVVEDAVPLSSEEERPDPDRGTADIPEAEGKTATAFSGAANAFGVHVLGVGGIPGALDNYDPTCFPTSPVRDTDANRRCLADRIASTGNRELLLAQTVAELGSDTGAGAYGSVLHVPPADAATDQDFRSLATCFADRFPEALPRDQIASTCSEETPLSAFRTGTRDDDGRDVPFPGASCVDGGEAPGAKEESAPIGGSSAACDAAARAALARADTAALAIPGADEPLVTVAHASSSVSSVRTPEGSITTVTATVEGVEILGEFRIGRIFMEAITKARGRSGTTAARFTRLISDVHGPGIDCAGTCNPAEIVEAFDRAFGTQARLRLPVPLTLASPKGYQGLVVKDPGLQASDSAIYNDDSNTLNGLDLIVNNDGINPATTGPNARSRLVIGFAGVHAESRYGIFPLALGGGGIDEPPAVVVPAPVPTSMTQPPVAALPPGPTAGRGPTITRVLAETWRLIVNRPGQAAVLFVLMAVLASPVYLGLRSRSLARSLRA